MTLSDLKYAARLLLKSPWFTLLTVVVLAGGLAIGIYTFTALEMMFYRALPLQDGGSIVRIGAGAWPSFAPLDAFELAEIRAQAQSVRELGAYRTSRSLVGGPDGPRTLLSAEADWRIFEFTRTPPLLGRGFVRDDAAPGAEPVVVLALGSARLTAAVLLVISRGFSVGAWTLASIAAAVVLVVAACVLLSIYVSVRGIIRREPSAALRHM